MNWNDIKNHLTDPTTIRGLIVIGATIGIYTVPQGDAVFAAITGLVGLYAAFKPKAAPAAPTAPAAPAA